MLTFVKDNAVPVNRVQQAPLCLMFNSQRMVRRDHDVRLRQQVRTFRSLRAMVLHKCEVITNVSEIFVSAVNFVRPFLALNLLTCGSAWST